MRFVWFIRFAVISFLIVTYYCIWVWECLTLGVIYMFSGNEQNHKAMISTQGAYP